MNRFMIQSLIFKSAFRVNPTVQSGPFLVDFHDERLALFSSVLADLGRVEQFLRNKDTREACDVPCEYFAELFSDLDDEIKALKAENDLIKEDLTRLTIENVEQNSKINTLQGSDSKFIPKKSQQFEFWSLNQAIRINIKNDSEIENIFVNFLKFFNIF